MTVLAVLVIRTALVEIRHPGSARRQWCFLARRRPMTAEATVAVLLSAGGRRAAGIAAVAWAVPAGALVARIVHLPTALGAEGRGTGTANDTETAGGAWARSLRRLQER